MSDFLGNDSTNALSEINSTNNLVSYGLESTDQQSISGGGATGRNVVIFVADGLRNSSVNPEDAPTLYALRQQGVNFDNSHSLFPTFTTPNASAIATGHYLGICERLR